MKTDLYSKVVLTVIALSLSVIAIQLTTKDAVAQVYNSRSGVQLVAVCNPTGSPDGQIYCADVVEGGRLRISNQ